MQPSHDPAGEVDHHGEAMRETRALGMVMILLIVLTLTFGTTVILSVVP